jgi:hypothetical protein
MAQPSRPQDLSVDVVAGNVVLSWSRNPEPDLQWYAVYSDTLAGFRPSLANFSGFVPAADTTSNQGPSERLTYYVLSAVDVSGYGSGYSDGVSSEPTAVTEGPIAYRNHLHPNVPNPFNPNTRIRYDLERRERVIVTVYDAEGRLVRRLENAVRGPGAFGLDWDGRNDGGIGAPSGVYFCTISTASYAATRKMVLVR